MEKKRIKVVTDNPFNKSLWQILNRFPNEGVDFLLDPSAAKKMKDAHSIEHAPLNLKMQRGITDGTYHFLKADDPLPVDLINIVLLPEGEEISF